MRKLTIVILVILVSIITGCSVNYSFTGASIPEGTRTFQVNNFVNDAPLIEPGLDRLFTVELQDLIQNQTNLELVIGNADLIYEGEIIEYRISPTTAQANSTAAQNRLTIGVNVRFIDTNNPDNDFEQRFSFFFDYEGSAQLVGSQKTTAIDEIFERITQDIFNASLAKW